MSVCCAYFGTSMLWVRWQKSHLSCKESCFANYQLPKVHFMGCRSVQTVHGRELFGPAC